MQGTDYTTKEAILHRAREVIGIPLKEIDTTGRLATGKGAIGTVIEESWYGYTPNSESEPDFPEAGVELKVTPYIRVQSGIRAKERLVCNIINYMEEYKKTFATSAFWHKCNTMLLMSYEHKEGVPMYAAETERIEQRYNAALERRERLLEQIEAGKRKSRALAAFIATLKKQPLVQEEWNERLWITILDTATVMADGRIVFHFKDGSEITA